MASKRQCIEGGDDELSRLVLPRRIRRGHHRDRLAPDTGHHGLAPGAGSHVAGPAGESVVLVDRFRYSPAAGAFPLGLVVALLWSTIAVALGCLKSAEPGAKVIGWAHVAAAVGLTVASTPLVVVPAVGQVRAEAAAPREVRIRELRDAQGRANGGTPSRAAAALPDNAGAAPAASAPGPAPQASALSAAASR